MRACDFLAATGCDFFTGVPDSQLKALCDCIYGKYGVNSKHHIIGANEGNCVAIATGYYLSCGKIPLVYMQNSGEGNIINPVASLTREEVYGIPMIFVIGWRGEPGVPDEPQHVYQGKITLSLLDEMKIGHFVISKSTDVADIKCQMSKWKAELEKGRSVAFVVEKGALTQDTVPDYRNDAEMTREDIISRVISYSKDDPVVCTTGKAGRELFELRKRENASHARDFLTVGSMGHASSIALGIALQKPESTVWCIDGDGAALMHMGSLAVNSVSGVKNMIHVIINNGAHETVGGMPTAAKNFSFAKIASALGYDYTAYATTPDELDCALKEALCEKGLRLIEVDCKIGSRPELGRPTTTPTENRDAFVSHLSALS